MQPGVATSTVAIKSWLRVHMHMHMQAAARLIQNKIRTWGATRVVSGDNCAVWEGSMEGSRAGLSLSGRSVYPMPVRFRRLPATQAAHKCALGPFARWLLRAISYGPACMHALSGLGVRCGPRLSPHAPPHCRTQVATLRDRQAQDERFSALMERHRQRIMVSTCGAV